MNTETMGRAALEAQTAPDTATRAPQPPLQPEAALGQRRTASGGEPGAVVARWGNIPAELRERPQWCITPGTDDDKAPRTIAGSHASSTDPATWTTFELACAAAAERGWHIGFVIDESDPFACIDLDVKDDAPDSQVERHQSIIAAADSYTECSRSGRGWHILLRGAIGKGRRRDGVEVYSQERFIICTGDAVHHRPIAEGQALLANMMTQMAPAVPNEPDLWGEDCVDWSVAAEAAGDQGELGRLFGGDWKGRYTSQSEADLALVKLLLPLCDSPRECWLTFRQSMLGRRDKAGRPDYAQSTMSVAAHHLAADAAQLEEGRAIAERLFWRPPASGRHFRLLTDKDLCEAPPLAWLVKRIVPNAGIGAIYGDSGTFKSFLVLDLLAHISNGMEWFGNRVKAAPAVYVPFEGQGGVPNRVKAWRLAEHMRRNPSLLLSLEPPDDVRSNVAVIMDPLNLRISADRDKLVATLTETGWAGGVLCIDTLAHASSGVDENSSAMAEMLTVFQDLQRRLGGVILLIHHSGKDQTRGMRGWSGLHAAMDFVIECQRQKDAHATEAQFVLAKVKEGTTGTVTKFAMDVVQLGVDEDGDPITSLAVRAVDDGEHPFGPPMRGSKRAGIRDIDSETASADDEFIWGWTAQQVLDGRYPSKNSLKSQLPDMKSGGYQITQDRVSAAIERLLAAKRLSIEPKSANGNVWLRPIELSPGTLGTPPT